MDRRRGWEVLGVTTAAFFVTMFARLVPSPLVPEIMTTFTVSKSAVGVALTGMWAAYALFQFPGGVVADRLGERRTILLATAATGTASLVLAAAPSFALFAAFAVALGAGAGLYFTAGAAFIAARFENTGRALGVHEIGGAVAGLVAPVAAAAVAVRFGWRAGPVVVTLVAVVVFVLFAWRAPRTPPTESGRSVADLVDGHELVRLLLRPGVLFTTLLAMGAFFTWQSFASFFPTFLVEFAGLSTARASLAFGAVFALTVVGAPALGWVSDSVGRDATLAGSLLSGVAGWAVLLLLDGGTAAIVAGTCLLGVGLSFPGVMNSRFMDNLAVDERGAGLGLVRTVLLVGASTGSAVTGILADRAGWLATYGFVAGVLSLLVTMLVANRSLGIDA